LTQRQWLAHLFAARIASVFALPTLGKATGAAGGNGDGRETYRRSQAVPMRQFGRRFG
jgi:hypothetical protein